MLVCVVVAAPAAAHAQSDTGYGPTQVVLKGNAPTTFPELTLTAVEGTRDPGEIVITRAGSELVVTNLGGPGLAPGSGSAGACREIDPNTASCPAADVDGIRSFLRNGDDVVDASASGLALRADGVGGDDLLIGGDPVAGALVRQNSFVGGDGDDELLGGPQIDIMSAGAGNDILRGNKGNDLLNAGPESDLVDGGEDRDSISYSPSEIGVTLTLADGLCNDGSTADTAGRRSTPVPGCSANGVDRDLLRDVELASGTTSRDNITGGPADERIFGASGDDTIVGGGGSDALLGGGSADLLSARDGIADSAIQCGLFSSDREQGDRALADEIDPVDPSCVEIERGGAGTAGPVGTPPSNEPEAPPEFQPTPTETITPNVPTSSTDGPGAGGGDGGATPPELEITSPVATVKKGLAELRVLCVYRAENCVGEIELTARKNAKAGKGRKKIKIEKGDELGSKRLEIPWGNSEPARIAVSKDVRKLFKAGADSLAATAVVTARDGAAGPGAAEAEVRASVKLGAPRR